MLFLVLLWREFARAAKLLTLDETALKNVIEDSAANTANEKNYQRPKPRRTAKNGERFPLIDRVPQPLVCLFVGELLLSPERICDEDLRVKIFSELKAQPTLFDDDLALRITNGYHVRIRDWYLSIAARFSVYN
jgi:hypothetical protein